MNARGEREPREERVLVFAPSGRDGALAAHALASAEIGSHVCPDERALGAEILAGAGAVLLTDYVLTPGTLSTLSAVLGEQPAWSDLPILALTARGADGKPSRALVEALMALGNATMLERPLSPFGLVSAVTGALRARRRQYAFRDLLGRVEREVQHRDEFLAMLGHELRNPLGAIRNATELVLRGCSEGDPIARPVRVIDRQGRHMARMVDDLLDVSRVSAGKISLQPSLVDLRAVVAGVVQQLEPWAREKGLALSLVAEAAPQIVRADPVRLDQVFTNLVTNAIKYTPAGGRIVAKLAKEGADVRVTITDTGSGIAPEVLPFVFDLFRQAEGTLDRSQGGLGIGLTLVRALVALHGGKVEARSEGLGCGAAFTVTLTLAGEGEIATPVAPAAPRPAIPRHVLVVEDSADNRDSLRDLLEEIGHEVDVAVDGPSAVERAISLRPDVAVIDIGLPGFDGYVVAEKVRLALGPRMLLVALTGYGHDEDRRRAVEAGFDAHLTKPADIDELSALIDGLGAR